MILSMTDFVIFLSICLNLMEFHSDSVIFMKIGLFLITLSLQQNEYLLTDRDNGLLYPVL